MAHSVCSRARSVNVAAPASRANVARFRLPGLRPAPGRVPPLGMRPDYQTAIKPLSAALRSTARTPRREKARAGVRKRHTGSASPPARPDFAPGGQGSATGTPAGVRGPAPHHRMVDHRMQNTFGGGCERRDEISAGRLVRRGGSGSAPRGSVRRRERCASGGTESSAGTGTGRRRGPGPVPRILYRNGYRIARGSGTPKPPNDSGGETAAPPPLACGAATLGVQNRHPWRAGAATLGVRESLAIEQPRPGQAPPLVLALLLRIVQPAPVRL